MANSEDADQTVLSGAEKSRSMLLAYACPSKYFGSKQVIRNNFLQSNFMYITFGQLHNYQKTAMSAVVPVTVTSL